MPAGWNVRVTTFDSEGKPGSVRYFLAYEPDKERAVELVRKRVPVNKGEEAEAVAEVTCGARVTAILYTVVLPGIISLQHHRHEADAGALVQ
jgi:hypothetical protein